MSSASEGSSPPGSPTPASDHLPSSPTHSAQSSTSGCYSDELDRLSLSDYDLVPERDSQSDGASQTESLNPDEDDMPATTVPSGMGTSSFLLPNPSSFSAFPHATDEENDREELDEGQASLADSGLASTNTREDDTPQASTLRLGSSHSTAVDLRRSSSSSTDELSLNFPDPEDQGSPPAHRRIDSADSDTSDDITSSSLDSRGSFMERNIVELDVYPHFPGGRMLATPSPGPSRPVTPPPVVPLPRSEKVDVGVQSDAEPPFIGLSDNHDSQFLEKHVDLATRSPSAVLRSSAFAILFAVIVTVGSGFVVEWAFGVPPAGQNVTLAGGPTVMVPPSSPRISSAAIAAVVPRATACEPGACQVAVPYTRINASSAAADGGCGWAPVSKHVRHETEAKQVDQTPGGQTVRSSSSVSSKSVLTRRQTPPTEESSTPFEVPRPKEAVQTARQAFETVSAFVYDFFEDTIIPFASEIYRHLQGELSEYGRLAKSLASAVDPGAVKDKARLMRSRSSRAAHLAKQGSHKAAVLVQRRASEASHRALVANRCAQVGFDLAWRRRDRVASSMCRGALGRSAPAWCKKLDGRSKDTTPPPSIPKECAGLFGLAEPKSKAHRRDDPVDFWQRFGTFV